MCGIAGWLDQAGDMNERMKELDAMSECLRHRGPDEHGEYIRRHAALLHRRLSVIDPQNGQQPMSTLFNGEKYTIVYNGELYNTDELREELRQAGFGFGTHSDTEVLLKAYCYYKEDCAKKLNGIYALPFLKNARAGSFSAGTGSASSRCFIIPTRTVSFSRQRSKPFSTAVWSRRGSVKKVYTSCSSSDPRGRPATGSSRGSTNYCRGNTRYMRTVSCQGAGIPV